MYYIIFNLLILFYLPSELKKVRIEALLMSLIAPLSTLWNSFTLWKIEADIRRNCTGQAISIVDAVFRLWSIRITIVDGAYIPYDYFFQKTEDYDAVYFRNQSEMGGEISPYYMRNYNDYTTDTDFIVQVPSGTSDELKNRIIAFINQYTLAGKVFRIEGI